MLKEAPLTEPNFMPGISKRSPAVLMFDSIRLVVKTAAKLAWYEFTMKNKNIHHENRSKVVGKFLKRKCFIPQSLNSMNRYLGVSPIVCPSSDDMIIIRDPLRLILVPSFIILRMIIAIMTTAVATKSDIHTSKDIGNRKVNQDECKA